MLFDDFEQLKKKVDKLSKEKERAIGAYEEALKRIKELYGCKTLEEAKALLLEKQQERQDLLERYNRSRDKFDLKWAHVLKEMEE